ncbi:unnamed protein product [Vicia faba]|uniref:Uncharacterized protein n=1 Tax=Vicia faba TaxID=3906 RepID=A0AAV1AW10_VICFA|nr:unnamed protein product [Vicia faba]
MVKFVVPFVPFPSNIDPERDSIEWVRTIQKEFDEEEDKIYEKLIREGFLTEEYKTTDDSGEVSWRSTVTKANMYRQNSLYIPMDISRTCFVKRKMK